MRRLLIPAFAFCVGLVGSLAAVQFSAASRSPSAGALLGMADVKRHCRENFGVRSESVLTRPNASGWQCAYLSNGIFGTRPVVMDQVCIEQFGTRSHAYLGDAGDPFSWECQYGTDS